MSYRFIPVSAAYALSNLLTRTAVPLAETMRRDKRNQKRVESLHKCFFFFFAPLILFLKFGISFLNTVVSETTPAKDVERGFSA